ncbi:hypothetical protein ID866_12801 [Astraeus odoratus]|nr:hypothetical protein ID866_12801 [Astraeus odoratus]
MHASPKNGLIIHMVLKELIHLIQPALCLSARM